MIKNKTPFSLEKVLKDTRVLFGFTLAVKLLASIQEETRAKIAQEISEFESENLVELKGKNCLKHYIVIYLMNLQHIYLIRLVLLLFHTLWGLQHKTL